MNLEGDDERSEEGVGIINTVTDGSNQYVYDAIYRLIFANGREQAGLIADEQRDSRGLPLNTLPHANDSNAVRAYEEEYRYDTIGNIEQLVHRALGASPPPGATWTRAYTYVAQTNRLESNTTRPAERAFRRQMTGAFVPAQGRGRRITMVAEQRTGFSRSASDGFVEHLHRGMDYSAFELTMMKLEYPEIICEIRSKHDPGLQVADLLLWSAIRGPIPPVELGTSTPRGARDIPQPHAAPGTPLALPLVRAGVIQLTQTTPSRKACDREPRGTRRRTRAGSLWPTQMARTSFGTPCIDDPSMHRADLAAVARHSRWISIPPRPTPRSPAAVDHYPAATWLRLRAPLKRCLRRVA